MAYTTVAITPGAGANIKVDRISTEDFQRVKLSFGAEDAGVDVSAANPFPTTLPEVVTHHVVLAASTNAANIKASSALFRSLTGFNFAIYPVKVCLHNTASTPTAGAGVVWAQVVQAGAPVNVRVPGAGRLFAAGLGVTVVKVGGASDIADAAATATALNDGQFEVGYV